MSIEQPMRCLSVRQPWAWLLVNQWKNIENRPRPTRVRGRVLIHASKTMIRGDYEACLLFMAGFTCLEIPPMDYYDRGGIVGAVTILDCVTHHSSEWFTGPYGYVTTDGEPLPFRPMKGMLGFFTVNVACN